MPPNLILAASGRLSRICRLPRPLPLRRTGTTPARGKIAPSSVKNRSRPLRRRLTRRKLPQPLLRQRLSRQALMLPRPRKLGRLNPRPRGSQTRRTSLRRRLRLRRRLASLTFRPRRPGMPRRPETHRRPEAHRRPETMLQRLAGTLLRRARTMRRRRKAPLHGPQTRRGQRTSARTRFPIVRRPDLPCRRLRRPRPAARLRRNRPFLRRNRFLLPRVRLRRQSQPPPQPGRTTPKAPFPRLVSLRRPPLAALPISRRTRL